MELVLRDYQQECVNRVLEAYRQNPHGQELLVLPTGCHRIGQGILMYDGSIKAVEDIQVGDLLIGPDSQPRQVLQLHRGQDEMFEIQPRKGNSWVVNKGHVLTLVPTNEHNNRTPPSDKGGDICDVSVAEWFDWNKSRKHVHKLFRVRVDFASQEKSLPMHPYLLGVLLGDGGLTIESRVHLTNPDKELVQEVERILQENGLTLCPLKQENRAQSYALRARVGSGRPKNDVRTVKRIMNELGLLPIRCENRFVPHIYKTASREERLQLLAGLLDTDGYCYGGMFEYLSKSQYLANDICFVARSLGLAAYQSPKIVNEVTYYRVKISGDCSVIPNRILRKQARPRQQKKDVLRTGFTCIATGTVEDYYGFTLDGDGRYLLDDFTVTHNSGKTVVFSHVIHSLASEYGLNALIIAHRDELLDQAADKYRMVKPDAIIGKVGSGVHQYGGEVTVASISTISRPDHIKKLKAIGYGLIIIDEAHHQAAEGYQRVLAALPDAFVLNVTATPMRLDKKIIATGKPPLYQGTILDMIRQGYLCDIRVHAIQTEVSLDDVHTLAGDFNEKELALAVNTPARNALIVKKYQEYTPGKRAVAFCVTLEHASALASAFNAQGIPAAMIAGSTPIEERARLYKAYRAGTIRVLTNVMVLTEGWDEPLAEVCIFARPTQSQGLYIQMGGRVLRLAPGKKYATFLDITDNCLKHRITPQNFKQAIGTHVKEDESLLDAVEREENEQAEQEAQEKRALIRKLNERRKEDRQIDLFGLPEWEERDGGMFVLVVGAQKHRIAIIPSKDNPGLYGVYARLAPTFEPQRWLAAQPLDWCQQFAEKKARMLAENSKNAVLVDRNAAWRSKPIDPDGRQAGMLRMYRIPYGEGTSILTKGQASDAIDERKRQIEERKRKKPSAMRLVQRKKVAG